MVATNTKFASKIKPTVGYFIMIYFKLYSLVDAVFITAQHSMNTSRSSSYGVHYLYWWSLHDKAPYQVASTDEELFGICAEAAMWRELCATYAVLYFTCTLVYLGLSGHRVYRKMVFTQFSICTTLGMFRAYIQGIVDGSASKPALVQDTNYMVEKTYHIALIWMLLRPI